MQFCNTAEQITSKYKPLLRALITPRKRWNKDLSGPGFSEKLSAVQQTLRLSHFKPLKRFQSSTHFMSTFIPNISSNCSSLAVSGSRVIPQIALHQAFDLIQTKC